MKFYIITTILAIAFGVCVTMLIQLYYETEQIQKNYNIPYVDTPDYYKRYMIRSEIKKKKLFIVE